MAEKHFIEQRRHAEKYLIPYFREHCPEFDGFRILEVGCAEGGFLDALSHRGIDAIGLELARGRVNLARSINPKLDIVEGDITDPRIVQWVGTGFDLIVMRDVIEHIPDKKTAWSNIVRLLKPEGFLYISFPPRFSPFGGHHQNGRSLLRFVPYFQMLPGVVIRFLGKQFGEYPHIVDHAIANYRNGLSIFDFEKYCALFRLRSVRKDLFISRPVYQTRFGIKPRRMADVPLLREFLTFGCECLLQKLP